MQGGVCKGFNITTMPSLVVLPHKSFNPVNELNDKVPSLFAPTCQSGLLEARTNPVV